MKNPIVSIILSFLTISAFAQKPTYELNTVTENLSSSLLDFDFVYSVGSAGVPDTTGEGHMLLQDNDFVMTTGTIIIRRHGQEKVTIDTDAKEIVAETCDPDGPGDLTSNPSVLLTAYDEIFDVKYAADTTVMVETKTVVTKNSKTITKKVNKPHKAIVWSLVPKSSDTGVSTMKLYVARDEKTLLSIEMSLADGSFMNIAFSNFKLSEKLPSENFATDLSSYDDSWIITKL